MIIMIVILGYYMERGEGMGFINILNVSVFLLSVFYTLLFSYPKYGKVPKYPDNESVIVLYVFSLFCVLNHKLRNMAKHDL